MKDRSAKDIKVVLLINDAIFRNGLSSFISGHEGMQIKLATDHVDVLDEFLTENKRIDICIADLHLHRESTALYLENHKHLAPSLKHILFSHTNHPYNIKKAIAIGCNGLIDKYADAATVIKALLNVHYTGSFFEKHAGDFENSHNELITELELKVLKSLCSNKTNRQISQELNMSTTIITAYKNLLFTKLNVTSREMLIKCAYSIGLIEG